MNNTTLCYIRDGSKYLMLHRVSKKKDVNAGKWIGFGGHFEDGESPEECLLREIREETGLRLLRYELRGIVTFICEGASSEYMFLYTSDSFEGELVSTDEGETAWIDERDLPSLPMWEGDVIFLSLIRRGAGFFSLKLVYDKDRLVGAVLNGNKIDPRDYTF